MNEQKDPTLAGATGTPDISEFQKEAGERQDASTSEQVADVLEGEPGLGVESKLAESASDEE